MISAVSQPPITLLSSTLLLSTLHLSINTLSCHYIYHCYHNCEYFPIFFPFFFTNSLNHFILFSFTSGVSPPLPLSVSFCCHFFVFMITCSLSLSLLLYLPHTPSLTISLSHFSSHRPLPSWRGTRSHKHCHSKLHEFYLISWLLLDIFIS